MILEQKGLKEWQKRHGPTEEDLDLHRILLDGVERTMPYTEFACLNSLGTYNIHDLGPISVEIIPFDDYKEELDKFRDEGNPLADHHGLVVASSWSY